MVNIFDRFTKKGPTNASENLPYAFSHIASGAPPSVYMSMMTGNTFDEAMQETNNIPMPEEDMELDIDLALDPELDDPDAIEKAIYQLRIAEEKEIEPEEVLETPYGPGLSGEEIDLLLDAYPALDAGVDLDMINENFDEVDRLLASSGESIEAAIEAAEQRAEDEGDIGAAPAMMRQLGDTLGNSVEAMVNPRNSYEAMLGDSLDEETFRKASKASEDMFNKQQAGMENSAVDRIITKVIQEGDILTPSDAIAYLTGNELNISDSEIISWIEKNLPGEQGQPYLDELKTDIRGMDRTTGGEITTAFGQEGLHPQVGKDSDVAIFEKEDDEEDVGNLRAAKNAMAENLTKAFYTTMYSYPESGQSDVRDQLPFIFNDTRTLFFLYHGLEAFGMGGTAAAYAEAFAKNDDKEKTFQLETMEDRYKSFLLDYLKDPSSKRTGSAFQQRLGLIASTLKEAADNPDRDTWSDEFARRYMWVNAIFGTGVDSTFGNTNRRNLIKMAATQGGQGWYSSLIHRSVDQVMNYYENIGWTDENIFERMTILTGVPWVDPGNKGGRTKIEMEAEAIAAADAIKAYDAREEEMTTGVLPGAPPATPPGAPPGAPPVTPPILGDEGDEGDGTQSEEIPTVIPDPWKTRQGIDPSMFVDPQMLEDDPADWYRPAAWDPTGAMEDYEERQEAMTTGVPLPADPADWYQPPGRFAGVPSGVTIGSLTPTLQEQEDIDRILSAREMADAYRAGFVPGEFPDIEETMDASRGRMMTFQDYLEEEAAKNRIYDQRQQPVRVTPPFWVTDRNRPSL